MAENSAKLWLQSNLNSTATNRALLEIERTGKALPCQVVAIHGSIVKVTFEVQVAGQSSTLPPLILPKMESQWLRAPTQPGDFGFTLPADTYLGGVSGYGGVADLTVDYGNLSTLVWVPVGSTAFGPMPDQQKAWINGPKGAVVGDTGQTCQIEFDAEQGKVTITAGGNVFVFSANGFRMSSGVIAETHVHGGVQTGGGVTGEPQG